MDANSSWVVRIPLYKWIIRMCGRSANFPHPLICPKLNQLFRRMCLLVFWESQLALITFPSYFVGAYSISWSCAKQSVLHEHGMNPEYCSWVIRTSTRYLRENHVIHVWCECILTTTKNVTHKNKLKGKAGKKKHTKRSRYTLVFGVPYYHGLSDIPLFPSPFTHRCAVPTTRQILLCRNSNLKCGMKWPMWRGECYLPPCCNTVAGWAQSPLWYPSFKSRPFSLFVCLLFYFSSLYCNTLWVTNSLSPVCLLFTVYCICFVVWPQYCQFIFYKKKKKKERRKLNKNI